MIRAGERRLRPIMMTALATVAGMLPLAFALGAGSQMLQPLAIAVIGGIARLDGALAGGDSGRPLLSSEAGMSNLWHRPCPVKGTDMKKILDYSPDAATAFAAEGYKVLTKIKIGGTGGWDYVAMDSANRRLYASHGTIVEVVDPDAGKVVGTDLRTARRSRNRHRDGPQQGIHHQRTIQQRDHLRSEDAGEDGRAGRRQESRMRFATSPKPSAYSPSTTPATTPPPSTPRRGEIAGDLPAGTGAGVLRGGWRRQGVRQPGGLQRSRGDRCRQERQ